jgi:hypothetical protein
MFKVSTVNLSADTTAASSDFGLTELGELSAAELAALLDRFRALDAVQNAEADPHLFVEAPAGRFLVRTGQGRLQLYNARDNSEPAAELTADEIVTQLNRAPTSPPFAESSAPAPFAPAPHRGIAFAILFAGIALNGYTLYSAFYTESVNEKTAVTVLTDPAELTARGQEVAGTYATGNKPGDRVIAISADGRVTFSEIGNARSVNNSGDSFRLGRRNKQLCLATTDSGVIDVVNIEAIVYYRDTYRRTK